MPQGTQGTADSDFVRAGPCRLPYVGVESGCCAELIFALQYVVRIPPYLIGANAEFNQNDKHSLFLNNHYWPVHVMATLGRLATLTVAELQSAQSTFSQTAFVI